MAYATQADFEAYVEGWVTTNVSALGRLLERASRDVDRLAGPYPVRSDGTKFGDLTANPLALTAAQIRALKNATCAQAEYRFQMGEDFFARGQFESVTGPDFSTTGRLPRYGPKTIAELGQTGLLRTGARAIP